jgi:hypothetical protein
MASGYARGRARDEAVRAQLQPLAPGERPLAVTLAALLAAALVVVNAVLFALRSGELSPVAVVFPALMLTLAVGMWRCRYWAVLGFEALLGVALLWSSLSLLVAANAVAVLLCLGTLAVAGPLFWFLIRAMARIQLPARRPHEPVG